MINEGPKKPTARRNGLKDLNSLNVETRSSEGASSDEQEKSKKFLENNLRDGQKNDDENQNKELFSIIGDGIDGGIQRERKLDGYFDSTIWKQKGGKKGLEKHGAADNDLKNYLNEVNKATDEDLEKYLVPKMTEPSRESLRRFGWEKKPKESDIKKSAEDNNNLSNGDIKAIEEQRVFASQFGTKRYWPKDKEKPDEAYSKTIGKINEGIDAPGENLSLDKLPEWPKAEVSELKNVFKEAKKDDSFKSALDMLNEEEYSNEAKADNKEISKGLLGELRRGYHENDDYYEEVHQKRKEFWGNVEKRFVLAGSKTWDYLKSSPQKMMNLPYASARKLGAFGRWSWENKWSIAAGFGAAYGAFWLLKTLAAPYIWFKFVFKPEWDKVNTGKK